MSSRSEDQREWSPTDLQSRAYRESTATDQWDGDVHALITEQGAAYHEPVTDIGRLRQPEDYEAEGWDEGREPPKTRDEAREALRRRIDDPSAPDTTSESGAYDEEGD